MRVPAAHPRFLRQREATSPQAGRAASADGRAAGAEPPARAPMWLVLLGCFGVAALTLILPSTPTYDPGAGSCGGGRSPSWT